MAGSTTAERAVSELEKLDVGVRSAWSLSPLADLSPYAQHELARTGRVRDVEAAACFALDARHTAGNDVAHAMLLVDGLVRSFIQIDGRQVTFSYAMEGQVSGVPGVGDAAEDRGLVAGAQALVPSRVFILDTSTLLRLADTDVSTAAFLVFGLRVALCDSFALLAENVLWPLRQRIARHMLDLAVRRGSEIVVPTTVQGIADATGSVRAVVTRILKSMREEELITRSSGTLILLSPGGMHEVARGA